MTCNLSFPNDWSDLSQSQMRFVFRLLAQGFTAEAIAVKCLFRWNGMYVLTKYKNGSWLVHQDGKEILISSEQLASVLPSIDWIADLPKKPVRLEVIHRHKALPADFSDVPFEKYLYLDNLYQGYLHTHNEHLLIEMAEILYNHSGIKLIDAERVSIFYWFVSLKHLFGVEFSNFYSKNTSATETTANLYKQLRDTTNAQIRALTKGDITKEVEVKSLDTWRALTELDAQAKDYQELKSHKH